MEILGYNISRASAAATKTATVKKHKILSDTINKPQPDRVKMEMSSLRQAVEMAKDIFNPSWEQLYRIYTNTVTDAQVRSQYDVSVNKLQASPFMITRDGNDNEELTELFQRPWFSKYLQILFDAEMWGYTLVEFGQKDANGEFIACKIFPRYNVYPFNQNIIINTTDISGIPYGDKTEALYLIEIGDTYDIGLLELVSREVIWKAFARRDWSELSEKWGMPRVIMLSDAEGDELNKREQALRNFGRNGWLLSDADDKFETIESKSSGNGFLIYEKNIRLIDEQISKLMNGQSSTSDQKSFVGAAEVHERILNDYHAARLRRYTNHINYKLIPFLTYHGYPLQEGDTIRFTELDPKVPTEINLNPEDPESEEAKKKAEVDKKIKAQLKKKSHTPW